MMTMTSTTPRPPSEASVPPQVAPPRAAAVWGAMARKEARELAPVSGMLLLAVGAVLASEFMADSKLAARVDGTLMFHTATNALLNGTLALMAPVAALVIGFVQFILESRPDRFGFVVHRPVSRGRLFWCKAAVGIAMMSAVLGLPALAALYWASDPFHMPLPFSWWMSLPVVSDIGSGVPFYFAGALVARRSEAHWLGSRVLPVGVPVIPALLQFLSPTFGVALLVVLGSAAFMAVMARGTYVAGGQYGPMGRLARGTLGVGMLTSLLLIGALAVAFVDDLLRPEDRPVGSQTFLYFSLDGTPLLVNWSDRAKVTDLSGAPVPMTAPGKPNASITDMTMAMDSVNRNYQDPSARMFHLPQHYFNYAFTGGDGTNWFPAMPSVGGDFFVGFRGWERVRAGALGARGVEPHVAVPASRFPAALVDAGRGISTAHGTMFSAGHTLYLLAWAGDLQVVYQAPDAILHLGRILLGDSNGQQGRNIRIAPFLQTEHELLVLSEEIQPHVVARYPLQESAAWRAWAGRVPATGQFLVILSRNVANPMREKSRAIYFNPDGSLDHEIELPATWEPLAPEHNLVEQYVAPALAPPLATLGGVGFTQAREPLYTPAATQQADRRDLILGLTQSLLCGLGMWLLAGARRLPRGMQWFWIALALLLGVVSFPLLLCTTGLPLLIPCANCGRSGLATRGVCPRCGTARAAPPRNGTEIFAQA